MTLITIKGPTEAITESIRRPGPPIPLRRNLDTSIPRDRVREPALLSNREATTADDRIDPPRGVRRHTTEGNELIPERETAVMKTEAGAQDLEADL